MKKVTLSDCFFATINAIEVQTKVLDEFASDMPPWHRGAFHLGFVPLYMSELAAAGLLGLVYVIMQNLLCKAYAKIMRPKYYPQEKAKRERLAAERRKIHRRTTLNEAPTAKQLIEQYKKIQHNPREMIRFGSMLCDLEAYVDNSLLRDEHGTIIGRRPGIRGWLARYCPELSRRYKTIMRYKAMAEKFRQAVGLEDPIPAEYVITDGNENTVRNNSESRQNKDGNEMIEASPTAPQQASWEKRMIKISNQCLEKALIFFAECGNSQAGLIAALDVRLDPDVILPQLRHKARSTSTLTA